MHLSTILAGLTLAGGSSALMKGFNIPAERSDNGACKSQADWTADFRAMQAINPGAGRLKFTHARLYASSDCNTLANAVPAAIATNTKLLVGVWTEDDAHYGREKDALLTAVKQHGVGWISAVGVGSEDLYRKDTPAWRLAQQVYDVRGMLGTVPGGAAVKVGHVDTWTAWVDGANADVVKAVDWIGFDGYPYWQGAAIAQAPQVFTDSINAVKATLRNNNRNIPIYVTETGWPYKGAKYGNAVASPANAQTYYQTVACPTFRSYDTWYYSLQEYTNPANQSIPNFGVTTGTAYKSVFPGTAGLTCSS